VRNAPIFSLIRNDSRNNFSHMTLNCCKWLRTLYVLYFWG